MGASDGYVVGLTKVVDHGPASARFNFAIVAEGFQAFELPKFHNEVSKFVDKLFNMKPFDEMWCAINIYRLDVVSNESGADEPSGGSCTGSGVMRATYFDATFCSDGVTQRLLGGNSYLVSTTVHSYLSNPQVIMVAVNSMTYGGSGGGVGWYSLGFSPITGKGGIEIPIHEMGHSAFGLGDEYPYDGNQQNYSGPEPFYPDVTANANKATIKWKDLIAPSTAVPTMSNPDCTKEDERPSTVAAGTVGAFEGASHWHCGLYRPEYDCQMRSLGNQFCAVCQRVIRQTLTPFMSPTTVTLATPSIDFKDIPEGVGAMGVTTYRAAVFEVGSCSSVTLQADPPTGGFGLPLGGTNVVTPGEFAEGKIWISYTSTTAGATASGSVTVHAVETGDTWVIPITANTVARPKSAVALVLDHSGSMSDDAGDGTPKVGKVRTAAKTFIDVMLAGDGLGLVRFDDTAQIVMPVGDVASVGGTAKTTIDGAQFDPAGNTSIGDGLQKGTSALGAAGGYAVKAMVVLTDGMENTSPMISDVSGSITANTFGIGFGTPANVDVGKLEILTGTHEGYLLMTGALTSSQLFRLQKYFLQILAGVTNAEIVVDPAGVLSPGETQRIPFPLAETDYGADAILLATEPRAIDFRLEMPSGNAIDPGVAAVEPNIQFIATPQVSYYRMALPALPSQPGGSHAGQWTAVLRSGKTPNTPAIAAAAVRSRIPYNFLVHTYSNLRFRARVTQSGYAPGSQLMLSATLSEYDVPVEGRATVWAEMARPDGSSKVLPMKEEDPGRFTASTVESAAGLYVFRVRASGFTFRERPFTREQTVTAVIGAFGTGGTGGGTDLCTLLECLLAGKAIQPRFTEMLREKGIEWGALVECLLRNCRTQGRKG